MRISSGDSGPARAKTSSRSRSPGCGKSIH